MRYIAQILTALLLGATAAAAQTAGPGGGPGPGRTPDPWSTSGATVYYNKGGAALPLSVTGGSQGIGTLNAQGLFVGGVPVARGTGCSSVSGTCLDSITGFASTGFMSRTGAGTYSFSPSTGSGSVALATSPTLVTPTLGAATATSINKMAITAPATSSTLAVANGKTLTANNSLTLAGTDSTTLTFQGTDTYVGRATVDTFTNKTFNTGSPGNVFQVNGNTIGSFTGTGSTVVLNASPTFTGTVASPSYSATAMPRMLAVNGSQQSIPGGAVATTITGWTKTFDVTSSFNAATGVFTVPITGYYQVSLAVLMGAPPAVGVLLEPEILVTGVPQVAGLFACPSTSIGFNAASTSAVVHANAGDTITTTMQQNGASPMTMQSAAAFNNLSIALLTGG